MSRGLHCLLDDFAEVLQGGIFRHQILHPKLTRVNPKSIIRGASKPRTIDTCEQRPNRVAMKRDPNLPELRINRPAEAANTDENTDDWLADP